MFDQIHKEIDAVIISTPDHAHFAPAMIAMELVSMFLLKSHWHTMYGN